MKTILALSALLVGGCLLYRRLLLPWDKTNRPTMVEERRRVFGPQPVEPPPSPSWIQAQLKRHRSA